MAWDKLHKTTDSNGKQEFTVGYASETITLADSSSSNTDVSTSILPRPITSDITVLVVFSGELSADTYVQVEHSWNGTTWVKQGEFESDTGVGNPGIDDISKNMAKLASIDSSVTTEAQGIMMMYDLDVHGAAPYTRFTVKGNGADESGETATFYLLKQF